ncbi:hypothetical protein BH18ACI2_BH18ACI2_27620 [soil metagenome]
MSGLVIHVEAGAERHTEVLTQERIRIGPGAECDLRFRPDLFPRPDAVMLELTRANGHYRVASFDTSLDLTHNGEPLANGVEIDDGDRVRFGTSDLELQFFPLNAAPVMVPERRNQTHVAPFIEQAAVEAAATSRRDDAKVFLREFTRELVHEIKPSTKIITLLIAVALTGGILYLGFAVFNEFKQSRRQIEAQSQHIATLAQQVEESHKQFEEVDRTNRGIINSLSLAPKVWSEYGNGVCLISGSYIFVERGTGRPLRYPEAQSSATDSLEEPPGAPLLTPEGRGDVAEFPYVGTGFHVGDGYILTNRHIAAEPCVADERSLVFSSTVSGQPRLTKLSAYFPGLRQPLTLKFRNASRQDDLAVCQIEIAKLPEDIPTLPLDQNSDAAAVGKAVVLMGYPSGPDRILASLTEEDANSIKQRFGSSLDVLVGHLAERSLIKPLTTQGHITALEGHRIVYDASTAQGGSGAPLFGQSGEVIGVNFAVFTEMTSANFAVPVRYAIALLKRAGWQPAETDEATNVNGNANSNANAKETKPCAGNTNQAR